MKISIVVPVYQVVQWIETCVDSLLSQTYTDFEVILVDDCSTDGSESVCDRYGSDSRVTVVHRKKNGITRTEISEIITHIAFYAGWPKAWAAFRQAKEVWKEDTSVEDAKSRFQQEMIFPIGEPNVAYAQYFKGNSYLARISSEQVPIANV
ncbi:MAG: glycosyltransferase, partial [Muribaculaceae bacterium]|nr:glycosyltransferase [Muribaculaceae bacterium]